MLSQFWRLEVQNQGVSSSVSFSKGELFHACLLARVVNNPWHFLASSHITLISAFVFTCSSYLCLCLNMGFLGH